MNRGAAVISIDTEQIWGYFDLIGEQQFEARYPDARATHHRLLELLSREGIGATWAVVGALCPVHHFVRIGAHSFIGGGTTITRDVLPFSKTAAARDTHAYGLNAVGLERRGFSKERIRKIHHAYKLLLASKLNTSQALERMKSEPDRGDDVDLLIRFIEASERGVIK